MNNSRALKDINLDWRCTLYDSISKTEINMQVQTLYINPMCRKKDKIEERRAFQERKPISAKMQYPKKAQVRVSCPAPLRTPNMVLYAHT